MTPQSLLSKLIKAFYYTFTFPGFYICVFLVATWAFVLYCQGQFRSPDEAQQYCERSYNAEAIICVSWFIWMAVMYITQLATTIHNL